MLALRARSPFDVPELAEIIFLKLDRYDLCTRVALVCRKWRDYVTKFSVLRSFAYKFPLSCIKGENPHFQEPCAAYEELEREFDSIDVEVSRPTEGHWLNEADSEWFNEVVSDLPVIGVKSGHYAGKHVLAAMREAHDAFIPFVHHGERDSNRHLESYSNRVRRIRSSFEKAQDASDWHPALQSIHCTVCDVFHLKFLAEHLHPKLRFMKDIAVCVRGQGSELYLSANFALKVTAPKLCFKDAYIKIIEFAQALSIATKDMENDANCNDFAFRPGITKIVMYVWPAYHVVQAKGGLLLKRVLQFLVEYLRSRLLHIRSTLHRNLRAGLPPTVLNEEDLGLPVACAENSHEARKTHFPQVVAFSDEMVAKIDNIMAGVSDWEPIARLKWADMEKAFAMSRVNPVRLN